MIRKKINTTRFKELKLSNEALSELTEEEFKLYKKKSEDYLDSIIEFKGDFKDETGIDLRVNSSFKNDCSITFMFECNGRLKEAIEDIKLNVVLYKKNNKIINTDYVYKYSDSPIYEVLELIFLNNEYDYVGDIGRVTIYWSKN